MDRRKQLKLDYKETPRPMGVYQILNIKNNKIYVGSSLNLPGKFNSNRFQLELKSHYNKALQEDWNLYGAESFSFEVLENLDPKKIVKEDWPKALAELEKKWSDHLQPYGEKGYNKPNRKKDEKAD
ncbi:MAG: excinuclease ABC subunit C [Gracilibacter sp. BRH_c7a]|nr:MAG: excinuclease ABC subunit C [Gracilibacter sp. BRH_c7a]